MSTAFQRRVEDFTCDKCGTEVHGNGYTNHCPQCLWSKHVDKHPGDRLEGCGGLMEPIDVQVNGDEYDIVHRCLKCYMERRNRASEHDNRDAMYSLRRSSV